MLQAQQIICRQYQAVQKVTGYTDIPLLQKDNHKLTKNFQDLGLNNNPIKSKVLWIGKRKDFPEPKFTMVNKTGSTILLELVDSEQDLGIVLDFQLKFYGQTEKIVAKATQLVGLIRQSFKYLDFHQTLQRTCQTNH